MQRRLAMTVRPPWGDIGNVQFRRQPGGCLDLEARPHSSAADMRRLRIVDRFSEGDRNGKMPGRTVEAGAHVGIEDALPAIFADQLDGTPRPDDIEVRAPARHVSDQGGA
ncbi:MAG: hypothetical protein E5W38_32845, partial [Mesorhizobium sp.]